MRISSPRFLKSCEVAALFCCLGLYSVGPLLRTSQVWPHSILGCLDLFRSPSQSQGGSQRPWSLSSFSRADMASKQIPQSILRYVLKVFLYMQILIGYGCDSALMSFLVSNRSVLVEFWNPNPERCQPNNSRSFNCNMQLAEILAMGSAARGLLVTWAAVDMLLTHHKPDWFYFC